MTLVDFLLCATVDVFARAICYSDVIGWTLPVIVAITEFQIDVPNAEGFACRDLDGSLAIQIWVGVCDGVFRACNDASFCCY